MSRFLKVVLFISLFLGTAAAAEKNIEQPPEKITLGMIPAGDPEKMSKQALELAQALQSSLNIPVNIYISKNYAGLVEAMKTKKVDYAFFSSMTYVAAEKTAGAKVLLKKVWEQPYYYSALLVRANSKIKNPEQLKGKKIAFVDDKSSSGYLYPKSMLQKRGLDKQGFFKEIIFSGNHQASVHLLEESKVDAIAVFADDAKGKMGAWSKFATNPKIKTEVLWISEPIPNDAFCVRQDFYDEHPKITHTLMFTLIDIVAADKTTKKFTEVLGNKDLMPATSRQYDSVREMVRSMKIELK